MNLTKVISTSYNDLKQLLIKVRRFGKTDIQTPFAAAPFGMDSNPIKDMVAVYCQTEEKGNNVIVGYLTKNQLAAAGETRLFSVNAQGQLQIYLWLHNNGKMDVGGDSKHFTRFEENNDGFNQLRTDLNNLITAFNSHTHSYVSPTGPAITGPATPQGVASSASIASSKTDDIRTK